MAAKKNPKVDEAYKLYKDGMKLVDIANQLGIPSGTVRRWKSTYEWDTERSDKKNERSEKKGKKKANVRIEHEQKCKVIDDGTKETLENMELTEKEQIFCLYYIKSFNATQSYIKAYGCSYNVANAEAYKMLVKPCVKAEIERLKEIKRQQIVINESDVVELQMRIAFADMGNYISFGTIDEGEKSSSVKLKDSNRTDTQLIREVKEGKSGISIKLEDRQRAIDWLTKYFLMNPMDKHKQEFDRQKLELELLKLEMQTKSEEDTEDMAEDNFIEALNAAAKDVWSDE